MAARVRLDHVITACSYEGQGLSTLQLVLSASCSCVLKITCKITPTTPAQIFHALRRQAVRPIRKPLIVMSPKSLLRHKLATSELEELSTGHKFETVISEIDEQDNDKITCLVLCGGKVYYAHRAAP